MLLLDSLVVALAQENRLQNNRRSLTAEELEERKLTIVSSLSRFHTSSNPVTRENSSSEDQMESASSSSLPRDPDLDQQKPLSIHEVFSPENSRSDFSQDTSLEAIFSKLVTREQEKIRQHGGKNRFEWESRREDHQIQSTGKEKNYLGYGYHSPHNTPSSSAAKINTSRDKVMYDEQGDQDQDHEDEFTNLSPTTVFHYGRTAGSSSSESTPPTLNSILPFPASFPAVTTPMEALLLANNGSFSFSMSQAVPDSPTESPFHAMSPLSFDTGSPCQHILPGRLDFYTHYLQQQQEQQQAIRKSRAKSGPQKFASSSSSSSLWGLSKSISFSGAGPRHSSSDIFFLAKRNNQQYVRSRSSANIVSEKRRNSTTISLPETKEASSRSSSKNSNTTATTAASSEFSIELNGSRPSGIDTSALNSSRYLDLDFTKNVSGELGAKEKQSLYDIKAEIRSRVEEVVRNTDESKFTFSPVNSSFLFAKSTSRESGTGLYSGNLNLDALMISDFQTEGKSSSVNDGARTRSIMYRNGSDQAPEPSKAENTDWFSWICCCSRRSKSSP